MPTSLPPMMLYFIGKVFPFIVRTYRLVKPVLLYVVFILGAAFVTKMVLLPVLL